MSSASPGRNDPCSCGSGKKYKNCCEGKQAIVVKRAMGVPYWVLGVVAVAIIGGAIYYATRDRGQTAQLAAPQPSGPTRTGTPWEYDEATNAHWDPGHGHWHEGPPPATIDRDSASAGAGPAPPVRVGQSTLPPSLTPSATSTPSPTPAPYEYDPATNRHWDPAHGHWHDGPPPAGSGAP